MGRRYTFAGYPFQPERWAITATDRSPKERQASVLHQMVGMRAASASIRFGWALLFALLLSLRLIGSAGYMPAVDHGSLAIIVCPGADLDAPLSLRTVHHHGQMRHKHATCPYAAAAALGAVGNEWTPLVGMIFFAVALLLGRTFLFVERQSSHERPPAIGPPMPA